MKRNTQIFLISLFSVSLLCIILLLRPAGADEQDYYLKLKKSWLYMQKVYEDLNQHYVEEVDPYPLIKAGIDGMLEKLDPYTVFIEDEADRRIQMITTGKYGGLGMEIGLRNKKVTVISPIDNSPAQKMGVLAGDIIEKINGEDISNISVDEVSRKLRGQVGTEVNLTLSREGNSEPYEITLTRAEITIEDVGYAGFIQPGIGYVSLNGFTDKAPSELQAAIKKLQDEHEIRAFVLDLRGNPGGLLESAVDVVNIFVDKNELVVFTKGFREKEAKFYTRYKPLLPDVPLAVLVDEGSASASEIVAGALQDLDRAVIVGEPTFGKGLVQKVFPIDKNEDVKLKITTARYYVPSGRCIQKRDYGNGNDIVIRDSLEQDDSVHEFYTRNKRKVLDKGGIYPDIEVPGDSLNQVVIELIRKSMFFDFAVKFHNAHPEWDGFTVLPDSLPVLFKDYTNQRNFTFESDGIKEVKRLQNLADQKGYSANVQKLIAELNTSLKNEKADDWVENSDAIARVLRLELAEKYIGEKESDRLALEYDTQAGEAVKVLKNDSKYVKILAIK
jgi:carboxyl-terminal processing protease